MISKTHCNSHIYPFEFLVNSNVFFSTIFPFLISNIFIAIKFFITVTFVIYYYYYMCTFYYSSIPQATGGCSAHYIPFLRTKRTKWPSPVTGRFYFSIISFRPKWYQRNNEWRSTSHYLRMLCHDYNIRITKIKYIMGQIIIYLFLIEWSQTGNIHYWRTSRIYSKKWILTLFKFLNLFLYNYKLY